MMYSLYVLRKRWKLGLNLGEKILTNYLAAGGSRPSSIARVLVSEAVFPQQNPVNCIPSSLICWAYHNASEFPAKSIKLHLPVQKAIKMVSSRTYMSHRCTSYFEAGAYWISLSTPDLNSKKPQKCIIYLKKS